MNTTCLYLSEARSKVPPSTYPRLHSLRSLSLGLLRASISEAVSHYCTWMERIRVTSIVSSLSLTVHIRNFNIHMLWIEESRRDFGYDKLNAPFRKKRLFFFLIR